MKTNTMRALGALALLGISASPVFACEDGADATMPGATTYGTHTVQSTTSVSAAMVGSAPQAQLPARSAQNAKTDSAAPVLMFEKPFQKWWTED